MRIKFIKEPSYEEFLSFTGKPRVDNPTYQGMYYYPERTAVRNFMGRNSNMTAVRKAAVEKLEIVDFLQALIIMRGHFYSFVFKYPQAKKYLCHADNWQNEQLGQVGTNLRKAGHPELGEYIATRYRIRSVMNEETLRYDATYTDEVIREVKRERY